jgi:serpin B
MDVVLPGSHEHTPTEAFDADALGRALERLEPGKVKLLLPRFQAELGSASLVPLLKAAGVKALFEPGRADLSALAGSPGELWVSDVLHGAFVKVDEQGTEASGATAVVITTKSARPALPVVAVNRPFLFFVRQRGSGLILFAGRVGHPSS